MRTHRISLLGAVVVVVAAVSGGCGGNGGSKAKTASTAAASSGGMVIKTVTVHDGTVTHALAVEGNGVDENSADISAGSSGTLKVTLPKAGTYEIYCPVDGHKNQGMKGKITVGGSSGSGTSGAGTTETTGTSTGTSTGRDGY